MEPGGDLVRHRVADAAEAELVGREREQAQLRDWLQPGRDPAVVFVSGPGGIGKSALVRGALSSAGLKALVLDGHDAEPTPPGVLRAIGEAMGERIPATPQEAGAAIAAAGATVVVVEAFEVLNLIDGWLRNDLLVQLPASVTTVVVGRRPPNVAWRTSPGWRRLLAELVVGPLTDQEAQQLVGRHPLPDTVQQLILRFSRGHPLALELAAEALSRHPALELPDGPPAEVVEELFEVLLNDLSDADRETVEAASILRRITRPLLDAVMADDHAPNAIDDAWRMLRNLPFVSTTSSGLRLHAVAHNAIGGALEIRNPGRVRQVRRKAAAAVLRDTADGPSWDATADLLFLVQNPIIRNSYVPPGDQQHPVERAARDDLPAILAIAEEHDGLTGAIRLEQWWRAHRDRFVVGRGRDGEVTAFSVVVPLSAVDRDLARTDELLQVVLDDLRRSPIGDGEECLLLRRALGLRRGELPSPELGAMIVDVKRQYLELRRVLARTYAATAHWNILAPLLRSMGFEPFTPETTVGDQSLKPCVLEFGPDHVDGWLLNHILVETTELGAKETTQEIIPASSSSSTPPISRLSAREREVVAVLAEGLTNTEIAERLFISERTANRHLSNIFTKLGVRNRTAAARIAMQAGLTG